MTDDTPDPDDLDDHVLVAAIMDDSRGYASPAHAERHVEEYREGHVHIYCERGMACFGCDEEDFTDDDRAALTGHPPGDVRKLVEAAARHWGHASEEKRDELLAFAEKWAEAENEDHLRSMGISLQYPVSGP